MPFDLKGDALRETIRHEGVHQFLSPKISLFRDFRAQLNMRGYDNSHLLCYLEEAAAEAYATGNLLKGLKFPLENNYVNVWRVILEGYGGYVSVTTGTEYLLGSGD